jgi:C4-dicarboxylate-specific signal transduction histidine kinase
MKMRTTVQHRPDPSLSRDLMETNRQASDSESQGMAIVGQVAGGILHDFNNILTVITGTIDILAQAVVDQPDLAAVARLIDEAASRGARLTSQLMAFAQGRPPRPCDVDINELLADAGRLLRPTLGTEIEVAARVAPGTPTAFADPGQLMAALLCLAIMARDAMAGGGRLEFDAAGAQATMTAEAGQSAEDGVVIVLNAHVNEQAVDGRDRAFPNLSMVRDFVSRSNGRLRTGQSSASGFAVEILLPRGEALLA